MNRKIFISHATSDSEIVKFLIDDLLIGALGFNISEIFCTSADGAKITNGDDWRDSIMENLSQSIDSIIILTPNYKSSEMCLNELGALWFTKKPIIPLIIEPIKYKTVGVILEPLQLDKLTDEKSLDRMKDRIQKDYSISIDVVKSDRWTKQKAEFLHKVKKYLEKTPFPSPATKDYVQELEKKNIENQILISNILDEKEKLSEFNKELQAAKDQESISKIKRKFTQSQRNHFDESRLQSRSAI